MTALPGINQNGHWSHPFAQSFTIFVLRRMYVIARYQKDCEDGDASDVFVNDIIHDEEVRPVKVGNFHAGDRRREMTIKLDRMGVSRPHSALRNSRA